jgi:uncharacterized membrane protein
MQWRAGLPWPSPSSKSGVLNDSMIKFRLRVARSQNSGAVVRGPDRQHSAPNSPGHLHSSIERGEQVSYEAFKVVHLFGVVVFLGNIIVTALWKVMADRTGDPRIIAYAQRLVTLTDCIFTAGGVALILVGAYGMAAVAGLDLRGTTWLVWGQALLVASGVIWVLILIPTQIAQARQAHAFAQGGAIPDSYWRHGRRWMIWGVIATVVPLANLYVMVFKP